MVALGVCCDFVTSQPVANRQQMICMLQIGSTSWWTCTNLPLRLKTLQRYTTILEVNRAVITEPTPDDILQHAYTAVTKVIPCDRTALSVYAPEHAALKLVAAAGQPTASFIVLASCSTAKKAIMDGCFSTRGRSCGEIWKESYSSPPSRPTLKKKCDHTVPFPLYCERRASV